VDFQADDHDLDLARSFFLRRFGAEFFEKFVIKAVPPSRPKGLLFPNVMDWQPTPSAIKDRQQKRGKWVP
jgi:hypothetical protein